MGTWGPGNFDNDGAMDYRDELADRLTEEIEGVFADPERLALDEEGETVMMPGVAVLSLLVSQCRATPPEPDVVARWRDAYLAVYDDQIDSLDPDPEFKTGRRQVILETFNGLLAQSQEMWREE